MIGNTGVATGSNQVIIGNNSSLSSSGDNSVVVGPNNIFGNVFANCSVLGSSNVGTGSLSTVVIGSGNTAAQGFNSVIIGNSNQNRAATSYGNNLVFIGTSLDSGVGQFTDSICIGRNSTFAGNGVFNTVVGIASGISSGSSNATVYGAQSFCNANEANCFGASITNTIANSCLIKASSNIRCDSNATCNLGILSTNEFNTMFSAKHDTSGPLAIATISATSLALGRAAITTTILGTALATVPYGSFYVTSSYNIPFTAGVNRLCPPTASSNGPQIDFSFAAGVLTYTGPRTNRVFQINYNINYNLPASGTTMTFFNSKNGNLTLSAVQARVAMAANVTYNNIRATCVLTDNIVLSTGDTVQLAASASALTTLTFDFNSCNITGLLN